MIHNQILRQNVIINGTGPYSFPFDIQSEEQLELHVGNKIITPNTVDLTSKTLSVTRIDAELNHEKILSILMNIEMTQDLDLKKESRWTPGAAEKALDKLQLQNQQLNEKLERCISVSPDSSLPESGYASILLDEMNHLSVSAAASAQHANTSQISASASAVSATEAKNDTFTAKEAVCLIKTEFTNDFTAYKKELAQTLYLSAENSDIPGWRIMNSQADTIETTLFDDNLINSSGDYASKEIGRFLSHIQIPEKIPQGRQFSLTLKFTGWSNNFFDLRIDFVNCFDSTIQNIISKQIHVNPSNQEYYLCEIILTSDFTPAACGQLGLILTGIPCQSTLGRVTFSVGGTAPSPVVVEISNLHTVATSAVTAKNALLNLTAGQTATLPPGTKATVTIDKTTPDKPSFNFGIPEGKRGVKFFITSGNPNDDDFLIDFLAHDGQDGDIVISSPSGALYKYDELHGRKFIYQTNIKGDKGDEGLPGSDGYPGEKGEKGEQGLRGEPGQRGSIYFTNAGDPNTGDFETRFLAQGGKIGDMVIDTQSGTLYKYSAGVPSFTVMMNITGPKGTQGIQGIPGAKGETGAKGDKGDTGATGATERQFKRIQFGNVTTAQGSPPTIPVTEIIDTLVLYEQNDAKRDYYVDISPVWPQIKEGEGFEIKADKNYGFPKGLAWVNLAGDGASVQGPSYLVKTDGRLKIIPMDGFPSLRTSLSGLVNGDVVTLTNPASITFTPPAGHIAVVELRVVYSAGSVTWSGCTFIADDLTLTATAPALFAGTNGFCCTWSSPLNQWLVKPIYTY